ncbi:solute carrier family 23 member 1 isoform X4 [Octopus vulgaris]|uniref:Solute carrier family 23 member 1 isoform X4 n=1 Tax=Octopus vulgaris TaxID=6645 RepID=A0AA36AFM0_OCTVU|nr:solute carrier family 23 member 1 isoform X4 [Octopus vulgaris]
MENNNSTRRKSSNKVDSKEVDYEEDPKLKYNLVYGVLENPPIYVSLSLAVQNILTLLAGAMGFAAVLADLVCVDVTDPLRAQLFSTTVILSGVATVAQTSLGTRTAVCASLFILYLNGVTLKFPPWSKKPKEIAIFRNYPLLLAVGIGWILCYIFTVTNYYPLDPNSRSFNARTDTKIDLIQRTPWFSFPYPGQYGPPKFQIAIFLGFLLSTINSIIESMGDYYAASQLCAVPPPPRHAINRGLFSEGLAGVLAGFMGASHATTSYSTHIALIGITKVASRIVLNIAGVMVIIMAILGKVAASLATIPDPVVGAINFTGLTMMLSVGLTNLQKTALNARNTLIIGSALGLSWVSSSWLYTYPNDINTGNFELDQVLKIVLGTQTFVGTLAAIFLDNTIPVRCKSYILRSNPVIAPIIVVVVVVAVLVASATPVALLVAFATEL